MTRTFGRVFILFALVSGFLCQNFEFAFPENYYSPWGAWSPWAPQPRDPISQTKCEEYSKIDESIYQEESNEYIRQGYQGVIGGWITQLGEFPHMAAIGYKNSNGKVDFKCGGSLISERFVLTAAHCETSDQAKPSIVRLGEHNLATRDRGSPEIDIPIEKFIRHENYNKRESRVNDIGLIKLIRDVEFSKWIRPACIAQPADDFSTEAVASGWGYTEYGGQTSDVLQKVQLSIIPNDKCRNIYNNIRNYQVFSSQLCAGELGGGKDTCGGDSGGPLQTSINQDKVYKIIGITSYGSAWCGAKNSPGIYTRVSSYTDWIEKIVWPQYQ